MGFQLPSVESGSQPDVPKSKEVLEQQLNMAISRCNTRNPNVKNEKELLAKDMEEIAKLVFSEGVSLVKMDKNLKIKKDHGLELAKQLYKESPTHKFVYNFVDNLRQAELGKWIRDKLPKETSK